MRHRQLVNFNYQNVILFAQANIMSMAHAGSVSPLSFLPQLPLSIRVHTMLLAPMCRAMPFSAHTLKKQAVDDCMQLNVPATAVLLLIAYLTALELKQRHSSMQPCSVMNKTNIFQHKALLSLHIVRNQGHFKHTNNCQLYIVLQSRTIYYQEIVVIRILICFSHLLNLHSTPARSQ